MVNDVDVVSKHTENLRTYEERFFYPKLTQSTFFLEIERSTLIKIVKKHDSEKSYE